MWARIAMGVMIFLILAGGGALAYYEIELAPAVNNILGHQALHATLPRHGDGTTDSQGTPVTGNNSVLSGQNRINILLLGSDTDGKNAAPLAQTDIVITIDQKTHYVGMLSIPRDLQVIIPGEGAGKMDAAFTYGWMSGGTDKATHVGYAAGLAEDTIAYNFGIHIDHYAWVGLDGFVKVIDTAGGVDVDVTHPMVDDTYPDDVNTGNTGSAYNYKRLYIAPGPQHLSGTQALDYVRTRHSDLTGDFGRSARQQQVLTDLKTKLATPDIIGKAQQLLTDLNGSVITDLQNISDVAYLANLARGVDPNNLDRVTLSPPYSAPTNIPGDTNFLPNCGQITPKISQMFAISGKCIPQQADSNSTGLAMVSNQTTPLARATSTINESSQTTGQDGQFAALSMQTDVLNPFAGIHGLLDLVFLATFESFPAFQV